MRIWKMRKDKGVRTKSTTFYNITKKYNDLKIAGVISPEEFQEKKKELLSRI